MHTSISCMYVMISERYSCSNRPSYCFSSCWHCKVHLSCIGSMRMGCFEESFNFEVAALDVLGERDFLDKVWDEEDGSIFVWRPWAPLGDFLMEFIGCIGFARIRRDDRVATDLLLGGDELIEMSILETMVLKSVWEKVDLQKWEVLKDALKIINSTYVCLWPMDQSQVWCRSSWEGKMTSQRMSCRNKFEMEQKIYTMWWRVNMWWE